MPSRARALDISIRIRISTRIQFHMYVNVSITWSTCCVALQARARHVVRFNECVVHLQPIYTSESLSLREEWRNHINSPFDVLWSILSFRDSSVIEADIFIADNWCVGEGWLVCQVLVSAKYVS